MAYIIIDENKSWIAPMQGVTIINDFTKFNNETLAYQLYYDLIKLIRLEEYQTSILWNEQRTKDYLKEYAPFFSKWTGNSGTYLNITNLTDDLNKNLDFFQGVQFNKVLKYIPESFVGLSRKQFLPILYLLTQNANIKRAINTLVQNGYLNEFYYIENNNEFRGNKYDRGYPTDNPNFTFLDPIVFNRNGIAQRNMNIPGTPIAPLIPANKTYDLYEAVYPKIITKPKIIAPITNMPIVTSPNITAPKPTINNIIPDQPIPKPMPPVLIIDQTTTTPGTTTPGPTTPGPTTPGTTTPGPTINKNILIIGGLIGLFLLTKK